MERLFTWNTNMVFVSLVCKYENASVTVWDQRIIRPDLKNHVLHLKKEHIEYYLTDLNKKLKDTEIKVFLRWEAMSTVGLYYADMIEIG